MNGNDVGARGFTALMIAAAQNETEQAAELIRQGAAVNAQNHDGETALLLAIKKRRRGNGQTAGGQRRGRQSG